MISFKKTLKHTFYFYEDFSKSIRVMLVLLTFALISFILAIVDQKCLGNLIFLGIGWLFELPLLVLILMLITMAVRKKIKAIANSAESSR